MGQFKKKQAMSKIGRQHSQPLVAAQFMNLGRELHANEIGCSDKLPKLHKRFISDSSSTFL